MKPRKGQRKPIYRTLANPEELTLDINDPVAILQTALGSALYQYVQDKVLTEKQATAFADMMQSNITNIQNRRPIPGMEIVGDGEIDLGAGPEDDN